MRVWAIVLISGLSALLSGCARAQGQGGEVRVEFSVEHQTSFGTSVFVLGDHPALGGGDVNSGNGMERALKLSPHDYPTWKAAVMLPPGRKVNYRFAARLDSNTQIGNPANGSFIGEAQVLSVPGEATRAVTGRVWYRGQAEAPAVEVLNDAGTSVVATILMRPDDEPGLWHCQVPGLPAAGDWRFRLNRGGDGGYAAPKFGGGDYVTSARALWVQDGEIFTYRPAASISPSQVLKISNFQGSLPARDIYIYLPRGYAEHTGRRYPVLYMHDGQNIFRRLNQSFAGEWNADDTADVLIAQGRMRETIIVGVSNGGLERLAEYLPPYSTFSGTTGRADKTAAYYMNEVKARIDADFRTLTGRADTATCGSSMGGVFSIYLAWEFPQFAANHAALSTAFWTTGDGDGLPQMIDRMRLAQPDHTRLWLDSGTQSTPGSGTDDMHNTFAARDALLAAGWALGPDFQHFLDIGAIHNEASWAARLDKVFLFLMPISPQASELTPADAWVVQ
ncbi:MAG: hypothetical protein Kow0059_17000 [Candidatus Sumerlaeia bacterium]